MTKDTMLTELHALIPEGLLTTFLYEDIWAFLKSLHYYKIRHVYDNREYFLEYVQGLDKHYQSLVDGETERMRDGETERMRDGETERMRDGEIERLRDGETERLRDGETSPLLMSHAQARSVIEGMFILSCMEFTCACPERMMVMQMDRVKK